MRTTALPLLARSALRLVPLMLCCTVFAQGKPTAQDPGDTLPPYYGPRKRAIVTSMDVKVQGVTTTAPTPSGSTTVVTLDIQQPTEFGTGLADMLTTALVDSKRFVVLERQNFDDITKERTLTAAGGFDPATLAKTSSLLGAQVIVRGAVTELSVRRSCSGLGGVLGDTVGVSTARSEAVLAIDLKIVDVDTGQVLDSVRAEGKAVSKASEIDLKKGDLKFGTAAFDNGPIGLAARKAITDAVKQIVQRTDRVPWQARVAEVIEGSDGTTIYLNVGEDSGLKEGDLLEIERPGIEIKDPDTQLVIGLAKGTRLGGCRVTSLQKKLTIATVTEGSGFQKADIVRFVSRGHSSGSSQ